MSKRYREWSRTPRDWLSEGHLVYFVMDVTGQIDLTPIFAHYARMPLGQPPYHPRTRVMLLIYAYGTGIFSSRKFMARCQSDAAFRVIVGGDIPDFRTIRSFRKVHLPAMLTLFVEMLQLCRAAGLLQVGRLALDGTTVKANASRHKAMSHDRMGVEEQRLQQEIADLLTRARHVDEEEDSRHGTDRTGEELPDELARRESRLKKVQQASRPGETGASASSGTRGGTRGRRADAAQASGDDGSRRQGPVQLHRSGFEDHEEDHEDIEQGLRPVRQCPGGGQ